VKIVWVALLTFIIGYAQPLTLSQAEKQMLAAHPMTCVSTDSWPPFNTSLDGKLAGIGIDNWRRITKKLNIPFKCNKANNWTEVLKSIEQKKYDLTVATHLTEERMKYAVFSEPYARYPYVAVTLKENDFDSNTRKNIAVGKNYSAANVLHRYYASLNTKEVESIETALKMVKEGKAFAAVDVLPVMAFFLNKPEFKDLRITERFPEKFAYRIMLRKDYAHILPLIDQAIDSILTENEQNEISDKWQKIKNKSTNKLSYAYWMLSGMLMILALLFYFVRSLKKELEGKDQDIKYYEELASFDSLTLIYNRHMLDTILAQQLAISQRYRQLMSVIFFDIDDFKMINDEFGHNAGDDVLIELTRLVSSSIRGSDIVGRWGGDEFLIILPESSQKQAKRLVEILDDKIRNHAFSAVDHLTCSFGAVSYQYGDTSKDLMGRVDAKLYEAKKNKKKRR
jgi:polar amino acid transport system substrate-binding protein